MTIKLKTALAALAGIPMLTLGSAAHANMSNGIVDIWDVGVVAVFDTTNPGAPVFSSGSGSQSISPTALSWGSSTNSANRSGIGILPALTNPQQVTTNGPAVANIGAYHHNQPIDGDYATLLSANIDSTLTLTPYDPSGSTLGSTSITFHIRFAETNNNADPCADGGANGSGINANGCADIFVIDPAALNFPFQYDLDGPLGSLPNLTYYISFFEETQGLNPLSSAACTAAGATSPCQGFETKESTDTTIRFASIITTEPVSLVPEPASLALVAGGLLALGLARRRSRRA